MCRNEYLRARRRAGFYDGSGPRPLTGSPSPLCRRKPFLYAHRTHPPRPDGLEPRRPTAGIERHSPQRDRARAGRRNRSPARRPGPRGHRVVAAGTRSRHRRASSPTSSASTSAPATTTSSNATTPPSREPWHRARCPTSPTPSTPISRAASL